MVEKAMGAVETLLIYMIVVGIAMGTLAVLIAKMLEKLRRK